MIVIARKTKEVEQMKNKLKALTGCHGHVHALDKPHDGVKHESAHTHAPAPAPAPVPAPAPAPAPSNASADNATATEGTPKEAANGLLL